MWIAIVFALLAIGGLVDAIVSYNRARSGKSDWLTGEDYFRS
jgi:hypothetical protein